MASDGDCASRSATPIASFHRFSREHEAPKGTVAAACAKRRTRFLSPPAAALFNLLITSDQLWLRLRRAMPLRLRVSLRFDRRRPGPG